MRLLLLLSCLTAALFAEPHTAHAYSACDNNDGLSPRDGAALPPRAKLVAFSDRKSSQSYAYVATLDGKPVKLKLTRSHVAPYYLTMIEVDSDQVGKLVVFQGTKSEGEPLGTYTVKATAPMPKEITATTQRFTADIPHSTVKERFDALAIDLAGAPAVLVSVKLRRDDKAAWSEFELPVHSNGPDGVKVLIGELGCTSNYTVGLLEQGIELQLTAMLPDGKRIPVKLPAKRIVLPKAAKQP
jgi:hypothetical protein